jgi:hypothetical protein
MAALNLAWEAAHVRLYTIWAEAESSFIAFSVLHCAAGDVLIGVAALLLVVSLPRKKPFRTWRIGSIAAWTTLLGTAYTILSEWMNVALAQNWAYAESMPRIVLGSFELGVTPLAQWLLLPPAALLLARWTMHERN